MSTARLVPMFVRNQPPTPPRIYDPTPEEEVLEAPRMTFGAIVVNDTPPVVQPSPHGFETALESPVWNWERATPTAPAPTPGLRMFGSEEPLEIPVMTF